MPKGGFVGQHKRSVAGNRPLTRISHPVVRNAGKRETLQPGFSQLR